MVGSTFLQRRMEYTIDNMAREDWDRVHAIYLEGIRTGNATFESDAPKWEKWDAAHLKQCRLVVRAGARILAWVALSPASGRCVYSGVAEVSLYVSELSRRRGIGSKLLETLIKLSEEKGIWTLQAGIFPENTASLTLVGKHGFHQIGRREKLGKMTYGPFAGIWRDVIIWERRSRKVGID